MRAVRSAPLKIILIILILSLLAKVGEWVYYQIKFRKRGAARKVGFAGYKDFAKDPNRHETVRQIFKAHDDDLRSLRGKLIGELVNELATTRARKNVVTVIEEHAGAAMPALLKALDNPKFRTPYGDEHRKSGAVDYGVFSPLEVVLECLRSHPHPLMVPKVLPFVADANASVRGYVAAIICGFPDSATLPAIRELLVDSERNVRHNAVYTLNEAVNVGRVSASVRSELYPIVLSLVTDANKRTESAPACLLALDRPRAESDLVSPRLISVENRDAPDLIEALGKNGIAIPPEIVAKLMAEAEKAPAEYLNRRVIEQVVRLLADQRSPLLAEVMTRNARSASPDVCEAVARAECTINGLVDPWEFALQQADKLGIDNVSDPVRHVVLLSHLIVQVENGGISQFFTNGYGEDWFLTLDALKAVGAAHTHAIMKTSVEKFGPEGPPLEDYNEAVAALHQKLDDPWKDETSEFYKDGDRRWALIYRYILANREHFE